MVHVTMHNIEEQGVHVRLVCIVCIGDVTHVVLPFLPFFLSP